MNVRILIIEDDPSICEFLSYHLGSEGFEVTCIRDGSEGLQSALQHIYELIILDLNLPRLSGIEVCKEIRKSKPGLPLIMLTSRDSEFDRVLGLESGADDYVVKPFGVHELSARIRARLRISAVAAGAPTMLSCGPLKLDVGKQVATIADEPLSLTPKEFDVLAYLLQNPGRMITRNELMRSVWGTEAEGYLDAVSTLIRRLRRKLELLAPGFYLLQVHRGFGYRMSEEAELRNKPNEDAE